MNKDRFRIGKTFISITSQPDAQRRIAEAVKNGGGVYVCVSDPRTVDLASKDEKYREVMENSMMNTPDGQPTLWAARLWGLKNVERTMGPILFQEMIENPDSGLKHFLLGDTDETLAAIVKKAAEKNAQIVGTYSPPFCKLDEYDYEGMAKMINESGADIVWTAMRAPKQDYLNVNLLQFLNKKICIGVGARLKIHETIRSWKLSSKLMMSLNQLASHVNPFIRGWVNYYAKFNRTEFRKVTQYLNESLARWMRRKYKGLHHNFGTAIRALALTAKKQPNLFAHWACGFRPYLKLVN